MSKRTFIVFGLLVVVLAVVIPWLIFNSKGDAENGDQKVPASLKSGQSLFQTNCGTCHTLYAAGTDGNYGPNLDELLAPNGVPEGPTAKKTIEATEGRVLNAVEKGVDGSTPGRMPGGILNEQQAKEVSKFVAHVAGEG
ncbi:MAG TPA: cytochrome c [Solirubrobacterales bacterium]|jgi:mono/diheme cytochrome c family protein|nr:cytochrome c [Solirubrobacterales bacterium]